LNQFAATVTGTSNVAVTWAVSGAGCSGGACATISEGGLYTAPASVPLPATFSLTATSMVVYIFFGVVILLFTGIILYALYQRRDVKAGLKIPFATFFFEAKDRGDDPESLKKLH
jgi:hypothetical protein